MKILESSPLHEAVKQKIRELPVFPTKKDVEEVAAVVLEKQHPGLTQTLTLAVLREYHRAAG